MASELASITALNRAELMNVVVRALRPNLIREVGRKFVPVTINVKADSPTKPVDGVMDVIVGIGLGFPMFRLTEFDVPPPGAGLTTVTSAVPEVAIAEAGIVAMT